MDRFEARQVILEDLQEKGLLEKVEPHPLSAGHCYRCHTIIEPYLSRQWFVKMKPLAKPAIEAVKKGKIKFYPKRWTKVYLNWMENIQDWCISRQIWWGHRIPVYYCKKCQKTIISRIHPEKCPDCQSTDIYQDEDVLDTWFSSWLWPFATFYWPKESEELKYFYPTSALVTAPEIIFFWVARMIMAGFEFRKEIPFKDVYIHGTVRDIEGKKMSKSLGNIIDPLEIINEYGCDALRFSLISITAQGQDVYLSKERFEQGRNFANKIWNASRFILTNLDSSQIKTDLCEFFKKEDLDPVNRWILSRFYTVLKEVDGNLAQFKFNEAANLLYGFFWHEFCDWYLELIKPQIKSRNNQVVMYKILEKFLRVIHPFMPFITEEIWQLLPGSSGLKSIMAAPWPHTQEQIIDKKSETKMQMLFEAITAIRNMRSELEIPLQDNIEVKICLNNKIKTAFLKSMQGHIIHLAKLSTLDFAQTYTHAPGQFVTVLKDMHIAISLKGFDIGQYKAKIHQRIEKSRNEIKAKEHMLGNKSFVERAPAEIVEKERAKLEELKESLKKLEGVSATIKEH
ncbi:MAG: class I tRNA ligase family protein [Candidatus Omnitrophica bacterium]|nr:class I tRNA ligase family protein [Candidatus Omnitrophota bacterium]